MPLKRLRVAWGRLRARDAIRVIRFGQVAVAPVPARTEDGVTVGRRPRGPHQLRQLGITLALDNAQQQLAVNFESLQVGLQQSGAMLQTGDDAAVLAAGAARAGIRNISDDGLHPFADVGQEHEQLVT